MYDDVCAVKPLSVKTVFFVAQTKFVVIPCTLQAAHLIHPVRQLGIQVYFKIRKKFPLEKLNVNVFIVVGHQYHKCAKCSEK